MEPIEFIYDGSYDMSHMVDTFADQCELSFGTPGDRKFIIGERYTLRDTNDDSDWLKFGFPKTINGAFGTDGSMVYTGICIKENSSYEIILYINGPEFLKVR
jgi:hypothetical protein